MAIWTMDDVNRAVKTLGDLGGRYNGTYDDGCRYSVPRDFRDGHRPAVPDCLVGHIVYALSPSDFAIIAECPGGVSDLNVELQVSGGDNYFDQESECWLMDAQDMADRQLSWATAVNHTALEGVTS